VSIGTWFTSEEWLPAIGYQPARELIRPGERRVHGLPARPLIPTLADAEGSQDITGEAGADLHGADRITVETVVGTDPDQVAVAPGALRRTWTEGGRRYFHYRTDAPIGHQYSVFSARYAVRESRWENPAAGRGEAVTIRIYHHPEHTANLDRILRSARASLEHDSREFGPYRYRQLTLVENPARGFGAHAEASVIDYGQGFALWNTDADPRGLDFPFAVIAHEMGHQFCCPMAFAEGAGLLTESFAWYSAMGVVEETYGRAHLEQLRRFFRQPHPIPPIRQSVPLLRAMDPYAAYRKGPSALFALREYIGADRVNGSFRRIRERYEGGAMGLPTSLDLYRELRSAAPDSLRHLVDDLIAANTVWDLATERASAERTASGAWRVTLRVRARKVVVDPSGVETERPMNEWVQVGVYAPTVQGADLGETLYLRKHRIRSGEQTIRIDVPREPSDAGVDPYLLLFDLERFDNVEEVEIER
jgi:ABC-2 type transport system permease protein